MLTQCNVGVFVCASFALNEPCVFFGLKSAVCGCVKTRFATAPWKLLQSCSRLTVLWKKKKKWCVCSFFFLFLLVAYSQFKSFLSWVYPPICMLNSTALSTSPSSTPVGRRYHRWRSSPFAKPSLIRFLWRPVRDEWLSVIISLHILYICLFCTENVFW